MRRITIAAAVLALGVSLAGAADDVNVIGHNRITVPVGSDIVVSVPFLREVDGAFTVDTVTGTGVQVAGTPLTGGKYDGDDYYVRFTSGAANGRWTTITGNTASELVLAEQIAGVAQGDTFDIIRHQTLASVFPDRLEDRSFIASTGSGFGLVVNTTVWMWTPGQGVNQSPSKTYYFHETGQWRTLAGANADDTIITPDDILILRNTSDRELEYIVRGGVDRDARALVLTTSGSADDTYTSTMRPVPVKLKSLGLGGSPAFESSTGSGFGLTIKDTLWVFSNTAAGINKSPDKTYYYHESGEWRDLAGQNADDVEIPAGTGMILRKAAGTPDSAVWTAGAPY